jgi:hypothetical protein
MIKIIASAGFALVTILASGPLSPRWRADLASENGSKISGSATGESRSADSTALTISIRGGEAKSSYAWHVHQGGCDTSGPIIGMDTAYPELQTAEAGTAEAAVTLGIVLPASGVQSVHVHPQMKDYKAGEGAKKFAETTVACGELKPAGDQPQGQ